MAIIFFKGFLQLIKNRFLKKSAIVSNPKKSPSPCPSSFTVQFLTKYCGFPLQTALSTSQNLQLEGKKAMKYESVVNFLKSHGFSDTHLIKLVTKCPNIFRSRVDKTLKPKFQYLIDNGFVGSLLPWCISTNPYIIERSLSSQLKPSIDFLKKYLDTNEQVVAAIMRASRLLTSDLKCTMQQNIEFLISEKVPIENISKLLLKQPRVLLQKSDRVVSVVNAVKELGIHPASSMFIDTLKVMTSMSDSTWKRKLEFLKSLGWSEVDIARVLKSDPRCIACSEEKIKFAMDFYVNTLKLEPEFIMSNPRLLKCSMKKRVLPRYNLFKFLESKGLIKMKKKFVDVLRETEETFLKNYVSKYRDQFPNLMEFYCITDKANK